MGQEQVVDTTLCRGEPNPVRTNKGLPILVDGRELQRIDCRDGPRPCPYTQCRQHLHNDYVPAASRWSERNRVIAHSTHSCALDVAVANPDGLTCREIGLLLGMTGERARQILQQAVSKIDVDARTQMLHVRRDKNRKQMRLAVRLYTYEYDHIKLLAAERGTTITQLIKSALGHLRRDAV